MGGAQWSTLSPTPVVPGRQPAGLQVDGRRRHLLQRIRRANKKQPCCPPWRRFPLLTVASRCYVDISQTQCCTVGQVVREHVTSLR